MYPSALLSSDCDLSVSLLLLHFSISCTVYLQAGRGVLEFDVGEFDGGVIQFGCLLVLLLILFEQEPEVGLHVHHRFFDLIDLLQLPQHLGIPAFGLRRKPGFFHFSIIMADKYTITIITQITCAFHCRLKAFQMGTSFGPNISLILIYVYR